MDAYIANKIIKYVRFYRNIRKIKLLCYDNIDQIIESETLKRSNCILFYTYDIILVVKYLMNSKIFILKEEDHVIYDLTRKVCLHNNINVYLSLFESNMSPDIKHLLYHDIHVYNRSTSAYDKFKEYFNCNPNITFSAGSNIYYFLSCELLSISSLATGLKIVIITNRIDSTEYFRFEKYIQNIKEPHRLKFHRRLLEEYEKLETRADFMETYKRSLLFCDMELSDLNISLFHRICVYFKKYDILNNIKNCLCFPCAINNACNNFLNE